MTWLFKFLECNQGLWPTVFENLCDLGFLVKGVEWNNDSAKLDDREEAGGKLYSVREKQGNRVAPSDAQVIKPMGKQTDLVIKAPIV